MLALRLALYALMAETAKIIMAADNTPISPTKTSPSIETTWLGFTSGFWDIALIVGLAFAALAAFFVVVTTVGSIVTNKRERELAQQEIAAYKLIVDAKVADAKHAGIEAGKEAGGAILRAAEANERAAKLEKDAEGLRLELAKLKTPLVARRLSEGQKKILTDGLKGTGVLISLVAPSRDREVSMFALDFESAFEKAGVLTGTVKGGDVTQSGVSALPKGVNIVSPNDELKIKVESIFRAAKIPFDAQILAAPGNTLPLLFFPAPNVVQVLIGPRADLPE
jgi:hypothetical protein